MGTVRGFGRNALEIFRGALPPQRSEEVQGRKISSGPTKPLPQCSKNLRIEPLPELFEPQLP
jgi:hypothetical protein